MGLEDTIFGRNWNRNGTKNVGNGHFRVEYLEGGSAGSILKAEMVPQVSQGAIVPLGTFFSDAYLIGQLANWIIDQIFEIELGRGND